MLGDGSRRFIIGCDHPERFPPHNEVRVSDAAMDQDPCVSPRSPRIDCVSTPCLTTDEPRVGESY
jgi:hypothetical protein